MSTATVITPEALRKHVKNLQAVGDRLEAAGSPDWFPVAQAAAVLDSLRLGLAQIGVPPPIFIGIDRADGQDRTVRSEHHA